MRALAVALTASLSVAACRAAVPAPHTDPGGDRVQLAERQVPTLPECTSHDQPMRRLAPSHLKGPAAGTVRAGQVIKGWSLDGKLSVDLAGAVTGSLVPMRQAACNLLAGFTPNNDQVAGIVGSGSVLELGRLTVAPGVSTIPYASGGSRRPARFTKRLAWILVYSYAPASSCPATTTGSVPNSTTPPPHSWNYQVEAIDAHTGGSAITYVERMPNPCGGLGEEPPAVNIPNEQVSVPWKLASRSANGKTGAIAAYFSTSLGEVTDDPINVERGSHRIIVTALRSYGAATTPVRRHLVDLQPATVDTTIPSHLTHVPTGAIDWPNASL